MGLEIPALIKTLQSVSFAKFFPVVVVFVVGLQPFDQNSNLCYPAFRAGER